MTVTSETKRTQYVGSGNTGPFSIGFTILEASHLKVTRTVIATGVDTELTLNTGTDGFTVNGGLTEVTTTEAVTAAQRLTIERNVPLTQGTDWLENDADAAQVKEDAFDKITMIAQQLDDAVDRSIKFRSTLSGSLVGELSEAPVDGSGLVWDGTTGTLKNTAYNLETLGGDLDAVTAITDDLETVADIAADVTEVAGISSSVDTVAGDSADIATVAGLGTELSALGPIAADITAAAAIDGEITIVANNIGDITGVAAATVVSGNDTTPGNLEQKLLAGTGITLTTQNDGGNETRTINADVAPSYKNNGYPSNRYFAGLGASVGSNSGVAITANTLYASVFVVGADETFTRIGVNVTSADAGNLRIGIYNWADGAPTSLVLDAGTVSTGTTGEKEITIGQALDAGIYAMVIVSDAAPTLTITTMQTSVNDHFIGHSTVGTSGTQTHITRSFTYGSLPDPFGSPTYASGNRPVVWLRKV